MPIDHLRNPQKTWDEYLDRCSQGVTLLTPSKRMNTNAFQLTHCFILAGCPVSDPLRKREDLLSAVVAESQIRPYATGPFCVDALTGEPGRRIMWLKIQEEAHKLGEQLSAENLRILDNLVDKRARYFAAFLKLIVLRAPLHDLAAEFEQQVKECNETPEIFLNPELSAQLVDFRRRREINERELLKARTLFAIAHRGVGMCARKLAQAKDEAWELIGALSGYPECSHPVFLKHGS